MVETIQWTSDGVVMIDQTRLPLEETYVTCRTYQEVAAAIRDMVIRGAPAIGVAAAMGVALGRVQLAAEWARLNESTRLGADLSERQMEPIAGKLGAQRTSSKAATPLRIADSNFPASANCRSSSATSRGIFSSNTPCRSRVLM